MRKVKPRNKVRFIWFGAEEHGLLGSEAYVDSLPQSERDRIAAMLNFDMIGSPNFVRFVYDGDLSDSEPPEGGAPPASADIERLFLDYFRSQGLATEPTAFDGRSDYGPFIFAGIPAGGLFTGAEEHQDGRRRPRSTAAPPGRRTTPVTTSAATPEQPQQRRARPDERRRRARDDHAGAGEAVVRVRAGPGRPARPASMLESPAGTDQNCGIPAGCELTGVRPHFEA